MIARYIPNILTVARIALIPLFAYYLVRQAYDVAAPLFALAALTDFADGYIARRFGIVSKVGATLDPIADKLNMLVATIVLALQALVPLWLAIAIVARDVVIVVGALVYRSAIGRLDIAPTLLSKLNTLLEFAVLLLVMAVGARWLDGGAWLTIAFVVVGTTVVTSGIQYVWLWTAKAIAERRSR